MATTIQSGRSSSPLLTADVASRAEVYGGRGLVFDGVSDYLEFDQINQEASPNYTLSFWANITQTPSGGYEAMIFGGGGSDYQGIAFTNSNKLYIRLRSSGWAIDNSNIVTNVSTGTWNHYVIAISSSNYSVYLNGIQIHSTNVTLTSMNTSHGFKYIGKGASGFYNGKLSDLKFFNGIVATEAQVQELYLKPESMPSSLKDHCVLWYPMSEANPESPQSIVYDHSEKRLSANYVTNSTFDSNITGWILNSAIENVSVSQATVDGKICLEINDQSSSRRHVLFDLGSNAVDGELYKISYYARKSQTDSLTKNFIVGLGLGNIGGDAGSVNKAVLEWDTWEFQELYVVCGSSNNNVQFMPTAYNNTATGRLFLDDVKVQKVLMGNHATTNFFGDELVGDSSFATGGSANINISGGTCSVTGGALDYDDGDASDVTFKKSSANILTNGTQYKATFTIANVGSDGSGGGANNARINFSMFSGSDHANYANGTHSVEGTADATTADINISAISASFQMTDISIKQVGVSSTGFTTAQNEPVIPQVPLMRYNQKMVFKGTSGQYVDVPVPSVSDFSFSFWYNTDSDAGTFIGKSTYATFRYQSNLIAFRGSNSSNLYIYLASSNIKNGNFIVFVREGTTFKIYIDGVLKSTTTSSVPTENLNFNGNGRIGSSTWNKFNGTIHECSIFNSALTQTQAQELFNDGIALDATTHSKSGNLLGYWRNDGVTTWQDRRGWSYLNFDGVNDNVENTSFTTHQTNTGTLSGWFIFNDLDGTQRFFGTGGNTVTGTNRTFGLSGASLYFLGYGADWDTSVDLVVGALYHFAVTWNGDDIVVYVNGTGYSQTIPALVTPTGTKFRIGENAWASGDDANMKCISASVYTATLSTPEIQSIYNNGHNYSEIGNSNLAHYWVMNNASTVKDLVGSNDLTVTNATLQTGNDGDVQGTPDSITIREGLNSGKDGLGFPLTNPSGNVLRLNGSSEYVSIDQTGSLPSGDQSRSITCWIKPNSLTGDQPIIFTGTYASNQMFTLAFLSSNSTKISVWGYSNDNTGSDVLTTDNWWYVGVTYDSGTNTLKSYIGGGEDNINPALDINNASTTNYNTTYGDVRIGRASTQDKYFDGIVDEIKIYHRALSADEILKDFKHQKGKHKND